MSAADPDEVAASASKEVQTLYRELALYPEKNFGWGKGNSVGLRPLLFLFVWWLDIERLRRIRRFSSPLEDNLT